jgi:hypothetical protein
MPGLSTMTTETVEKICDLLAEGEPLAAICRRPGMPGLRTVYDWAEACPDTAARIAHARKAGFDRIATDTLAIADMPPAYKTTEGGQSIDQGDVANRKLQIETRLKLLSKWDPKRYGDKLEVDNRHTGSVGLTILTAVPEPGAEPGPA